MPESPKPRRFQFSLRTALIVMIFAGGVLGYFVRSIEEAKRKKHETIVANLIARRPDGFGAWDFSYEHMFSNGFEKWEDIFEYCKEEGVPQRILDELVRHADDKELRIQQCHIQLLTVLSTIHFSKMKKIVFERPAAFEAAYRAGKFDRVIETFGAHYIRTKLLDVFKISGHPVP